MSPAWASRSKPGSNRGSSRETLGLPINSSTSDFTSWDSSDAAKIFPYSDAVNLRIKAALVIIPTENRLA